MASLGTPHIDSHPVAWLIVGERARAWVAHNLSWDRHVRLCLGEEDGAPLPSGALARAAALAASHSELSGRGAASASPAVPTARTNATARASGFTAKG